jgi:2-hydroxychromene-2-carboxylate isomerase
MHDLLFARQGAWLPADLPRFATELGLDVERFERDLSEGRLGQRVAQDVDSADSSGVVGTPTLFVNEVLYRGPRTLQALEDELARAHSASVLREEQNNAADSQDAEDGSQQTVT